MAAQSGCPIVPCVIWGSHRIMTRTRRTSLRRARHLPVTIVFGPPIAVGPDDDPTAVTEQLREVMLGMLAQAQADYPDSGSGEWWQPAHLGGGAPATEDAVPA
jgi:1-acyl-sn-glycerol-3-phosphate acyltransferase